MLGDRVSFHKGERHEQRSAGTLQGPRGDRFALTEMLPRLTLHCECELFKVSYDHN